MDLFHAFVLGVVEGVTEFLPVSSTGHLILASRLLGLEQSEFLKTFDIAIQLGGISAVVALYWRRLLVEPETMKRVAAAFVPTAVIGFALYKIVKTYLLSGETVVLWALFLGGAFLIVFELLHKEGPEADADVSRLPYRKAVLIGVFQAVAMVPGVSRSAATILGGLALGVRRTAIVEFSFLLAVPTMLAATAYDLLKSGASFSADQLSFLAVGGVTSFVVAMISIKFLLRFVQNHSFVPFGVYRLVAAAAFWALVGRS